MTKTENNHSNNRNTAEHFLDQATAFYSGLMQYDALLEQGKEPEDQSSSEYAQHVANLNEYEHHFLPDDDAHIVGGYLIRDTLFGWKIVGPFTGQKLCEDLDDKSLEILRRFAGDSVFGADQPNARATITDYFIPLQPQFS